MKTNYNKMILCAMFAALIAVGAFITIPMFPVPVTLQCFFTILAAFILPKYWGTLSTVLYIVIGLIGVPVFTKGGGISYVLEPSFGYLMGFIVGNLLCNFILQKFNNKTFKHYMFAGIINLLVVYTIGVCHLAFIMGAVLGTPLPISYLLVQGFAIFLPGNIAEAIIASIVAVRLEKYTKLRLQ